MESTEYVYIEHCGNDWTKYYDPSNGCYFYWNSNTQESSWVPPKKIFTENDQFILPIDEFIIEEQANQQCTPTRQRKSSDVFVLRCSKCNTEEKVLDHNYCDKCYEEINSYELPLIATYRIKCKGCCGWGINLIQSNGYCNHCITSLRQHKPINKYESFQYTKAHRETPYPRCLKCGGWGKDLLQDNGKCNYCIMVEDEESFERKWRIKCNGCGGWGLGLVQEEGFCNHCKRNLIPKNILSYPLTIIAKEGNGQYKSYNEASMAERTVHTNETQNLTKRRINELYGFS